MSDPSRWTSPAMIVAAVRRRWDDGSLVSAFARGAEFVPIDLPLRGPVAADLGDHFDAAREWADSIYRASRDGRAYDIVLASIGGRHAGRTDVPGRAVVSSYEQAWNVLGTASRASTFVDLLAQSTSTPRVGEWMLDHPLRALSLADDWPALLAAYRWLDEHRDSGLYLRQVSAPGVDTKFIEQHRVVLAALLEVPDGARGAGAFASSLGFAAKPATIRLRFDPSVLGLPAGFSEATFRANELRVRAARPSVAVIVENEITYLSVPIPAGGVVLWGKGFDVEESASLGWLVDTPVFYWGDLDTHGFAILNRVRVHLPEVRSILMDRATLLAHEERWGSEDRPTRASLTMLNEAESALYSDLVTERYGSAIRLEQERIDWEWAATRLPWVAT